MITVGMYYDVVPGKEAAFESDFQYVLHALEGVSDHMESRLFRDVLRPGSYLVYSEWASREDFAAFIQSAAFVQAKRWGHEVLLGAPRHAIFVPG